MPTSIYQRNLIERRKANKLCVNCGKPLDREGYNCATCTEKRRINENEGRKWLQENHICPRCGKNSLFGDEKQCPECSAKMYEYVMKARSQNKEHYNEIHRKWAKIEHNRRKENGICTRCGKRKSEKGYVTCGICRSKKREAWRATHWKPNRSERYTYGLCFFCDNPIKPGYKVCEKHYQMNTENLNNEKSRQQIEKFKKIEHRRIQAKSYIKND